VTVRPVGAAGLHPGGEFAGLHRDGGRSEEVAVTGHGEIHCGGGGRHDLAIGIDDTDPDEPGVTAIGGKWVQALGLQNDLDRHTGGGPRKGGDDRVADEAVGTEGAVDVGAEGEGEGRMRDIGIGGVGVRRLAGELHTIGGERDLLAVAEHPDGDGRAGLLGVGDVDHRAGGDVGDDEGGAALALEKVIGKLRQPIGVHGTAFGGGGQVAGVVGEVPKGVSGKPAHAAVEAEAVLKVVALSEEIGVGRLAGDPAGVGGGITAVTPVAVFIDDDGLGGGGSADIGLFGGAVGVKIPGEPAGGEHLVAGIFGMGEGLRHLRPGARILRFIEAGLPEDDGGVIAVPADHVAEVLIGRVGEGADIIVILPAGLGIHGEHAELVAGVIEGGAVQVVGAADEIKAGVLQPLHVVIDGLGRGGVAFPVNVLMKIRPVRDEADAVDQQAGAVGPSNGADADGGGEIVGIGGTVRHHGVQGVKIGGIRMPQVRGGHDEALGKGVVRTGGNGNGIGDGGDQVAAGIGEHGDKGRVLDGGVFIAQLGLDVHGGRRVGHGGIGHKNAAAGDLVGIHGVGDMQEVGDVEFDDAIEAAMILEIKAGDGVAGRPVAAGIAVEAHGDDIIGAAVIDQAGGIHGEGQITADVIGGLGAGEGDLGAVDPDIGLLHGGAEFEEEFPARPGIGDGEMFAIPTDADIGGGIFGRNKFGGVGQADDVPAGVVEGLELGIGDIPLDVKPVSVEIDVQPAAHRRQKNGGRHGPDQQGDKTSKKGRYDYPTKAHYLLNCNCHLTGQRIITHINTRQAVTARTG